MQLGRATRTGGGNKKGVFLPMAQGYAFFMGESLRFKRGFVSATENKEQEETEE